MGDAARIRIQTLNAGGAHVIFARIDHRHDNEIFVLCQAEYTGSRQENGRKNLNE